MARRRQGFCSTSPNSYFFPPGAWRFEHNPWLQGLDWFKTKGAQTLYSEGQHSCNFKSRWNVGGTEGFEIACLKGAWCTRGRWQEGEWRPGVDAVAISLWAQPSQLWIMSFRSPGWRSVLESCREPCSASPRWTFGKLTEVNDAFQLLIKGKHTLLISLILGTNLRGH